MTASTAPTASLPNVSIAATGGPRPTRPRWIMRVALLLGADRIMDSMRVFINLLGNCVATFVVANWESELDHEQMRRVFAADKAARLQKVDAATEATPETAVIVGALNTAETA